MELVCRPCGWQWPPTFVSHCSTAAEFRWQALVQGEGCEGCEGRWMSNGTHMNRPESYVMLASFASVARPAKLCHASHMHRFPEVHSRILHVAVGAASDPCNARSLLVVAWIQMEEVFFFQMLSFFVFPASCYIVCYAVRGNIGDVILYDFVTSFMKLLLSLLVYMVSCMVLFLVAFCCLSFFNLFSICLAKRENTKDIMANQCWKMQWNEVNMVNNRGNMRKQLWKKQRGNNPGGHCESGFPFFMSCRMKQHTTKRNQNAIKSNENIKPLKSA